MSEELSILSLVLQAGPVVQLVMATLVLASVFSWVVIFQRTRVYHGHKNMHDSLRIHFGAELSWSVSINR